MKKLILTLTALFVINFFNAQTIDLEKTYEITGKSKRGQLFNVNRSDANGDYTLQYITKATQNKVKIQEYLFDKDFNFKNFAENEYETEKLKVEFKELNYYGEQVTNYSIRVTFNPLFPIKLIKKETTYTFNWDLLRYTETTSNTTKVKPKTDDGFAYVPKTCGDCGEPVNNIPLGTYFTSEATGDLYVLAGARGGKLMSKDLDPNQEYEDFHLLKYDVDLNKKGDVAVKFDFPQDVVAGRTVKKSISKDSEALGLAFVTAPADLGGKFRTDPNKTNFSFVYIDEEFNIINRISFEPPTPGWKISEICSVEKDGKMEFYLYGPAVPGKDKYWSKSYNSGKYNSVQVMKIANNKVEYITETKLEEFQAKMKTPPSQKGGETYMGKKFKLTGFELIGDEEFLVMGQNIDKTEGPIYGNVIGFQFDKQGKLKSQYSVEQHGKAKYSWLIRQNIEENENGTFWLWLESLEQNLLFPALAKIDVEKGSVSNFIIPGSDGKSQVYHLNEKFPMLQVSNEQIVYFGNDAKGKTIWFCRVNLK